MSKFEKDRMEKIRGNISNISFPLKKWRYFILFQSVAQTISWTVTLLFCLVLISYLSSLDTGSKAPLGGLLSGALIGSTFSLMAVFPAKFIVVDNGLAVLSEIEVRLLKMNYVEQERFDKKIIYRQNLPRLLRWDEGNVEIKKDGNILILNGAYISIRKLRKSLLSIG
ncbi:hypothetical protein [Janthinobacterium aquaticum]|uniref:hypothetical protein n=1 Tax=Janthinobacterium sp. FT58W TaxID=2654254 RepID=UPI0012652AFD|nr:hypothetical protein [Janthinobacterium sp. FT58W]KAB8043465.1 hypothetical protein GCM43_09140 [Janthinobacterium sp. FT58W]